MDVTEMLPVTLNRCEQASTLEPSLDSLALFKRCGMPGKINAHPSPTAEYTPVRFTTPDHQTLQQVPAIEGW